jgi:hypothetical protein
MRVTNASGFRTTEIPGLHEDAEYISLPALSGCKNSLMSQSSSFHRWIKKLESACPQLDQKTAAACIKKLQPR